MPAQGVAAGLMSNHLTPGGKYLGRDLTILDTNCFISGIFYGL